MAAAAAFADDAAEPPWLARERFGRPSEPTMGSGVHVAPSSPSSRRSAHFDVVGLMREAVGSLLAYQSDFDAHRGQVFFATHWYIPLIVVSAYIVLLRLGVRLMAARSPFELTALSRTWNLAVAVFSLGGAAACVPHLARQWHAHGFWFTCCADVYDIAGHGAPALWAVLFTWSKVLELADTAILVLRKRRVQTLHWFHHASVIVFAWAAWAYETPLALWCARARAAPPPGLARRAPIRATRAPPCLAGTAQ